MHSISDSFVFLTHDHQLVFMLKTFSSFPVLVVVENSCKL